jgi:addiction module HigA family antidote
MKDRLPPVHPGEMLREEFMVPLGLSANALALALRVPATRINEIVNERRGISGDTAIRLGRYFRMGPEFWMNLQAYYDLELARDARDAAAIAEIEPAPVNEHGELLARSA